jgi:hypothetical protein
MIIPREKEEIIIKVKITKITKIKNKKMKIMHLQIKTKRSLPQN